MKGILAIICAFALMESVISETFPNDLFYHHHPDLAVADANSQGNNRYAQSNGNSRSVNYRQAAPLPRNAYSNGPRNANANYGRNSNRANYGHESINRGPQTLTYNEDGSINWAKSKMAKVAAADASGQQQQDQNSNYNNYYSNNNNYNGEQQQDQNYGSSPNSYGNQGSSSLTGDDQQSPRQYSEDNYYSNQDNGGNGNNNNYYGNNYNGNRGSNNNGHSNNGYYGNSNGNNDYYGNGNNNNNNGYYGNGNNNNNGNYGNNNNGYYSNSNNNDNYNNNNNNNADSTSVSSKNATRFAAGGLRLAGTLPDDGYNRGEGTFYDLETHIGTCGKQNKNTELVAALNSEQMGDSSRNNPNCGKEVEIVGPTGKTVQVTIVDNCKTCKANGLDLSPAAFEELGDFSHGSVPIKWKFV